MEHEHAEAFLLMEYATEDGSEREVLWNSRDGVTPFGISSATTGADMTHVNWSNDRYAPNHVPKVGDRIFVDMTEQRARALVAQHIESLIDDGYRKDLEQRYASREEAMADIAANMMREPDILVVTAGYLHELAAKRAMQPGVILGVDFAAGESVTKVSVVTQQPAHATDPFANYFFDRQGKPITFDRYAELFLDDDYKRVALTVLASPGGAQAVGDFLEKKVGWFVTTVWLGSNHNHSSYGPPLIFETMVWRDGRWGDVQVRYATEVEAIAGHAEVVTQQLEDESRKNN